MNSRPETARRTQGGNAPANALPEGSVQARGPQCPGRRTSTLRDDEAAHSVAEPTSSRAASAVPEVREVTTTAASTVRTTATMTRVSQADFCTPA